MPAQVGVAEIVWSCKGDGNLVLYADDRSVWNTGSPGHSGASLAMQDDSNLVLYGSDKIEVLWTSDTAR
jgi:pseudomonalisin